MRIKTRKKDFTIVGNAILRDDGLSLKAKGLACVMMSLPEDWTITTRGLASICKESRPTIMAALTELRDRGWLIHSQTREKGKFSNEDYELTDDGGYPRSNVENPKAEEEPWSKKPRTESLTTDKSNKEVLKKDRIDRIDKSANRARMPLEPLTEYLVEKGAVDRSDPYLREFDRRVSDLIGEYGYEVVRSAVYRAAAECRTADEAGNPIENRGCYVRASIENGCRLLKRINERTTMTEEIERRMGR